MPKNEASDSSSFLCQVDVERYGVQGLVDLLGGAEPPLLHRGVVAEGGDLRHHPLEVDERVAGEDLGQAVGEVAGQALARPLVKFQGKGQGLGLGVVTLEGQADVVGTLAGVAQQGVEELVGPVGRKKAGQNLAGKELLLGGDAHGGLLGLG